MLSNNTKCSAEPDIHLTPRIRLLEIALSLLVLLLFSCAEKPVYRKEVSYPRVKKPVVIVKLLQTENSLKISSTGSFSIKCLPPRGDSSVFYTIAEIEVKLSLGGITVNQNSQGTLRTGLSKVSFIPRSDDQWLYLNGKPYRGALEISGMPDAKSLLVLNIVNLEDYLKGVVPAEIGKLNQTEMEALKAQTIASRTYALFQASQNREREYDLEATVMDQTYSGVAVEDPQTNRAIQLTRGKVLTYKGKPICSYYSTNCGGKTEYIEKVWDKPQELYLIPVDDDTFCLWSKSNNWEERWTKETLEKNIRTFLDSTQISSDKKWGDLLDLKIRERSPSGRVEWLDVVSDQGTFPLRADKIRWALRKWNGSNSILPSTYFDLEIMRGEDNSIKQVVARGRGNGHGVGMCQTGAIGMARAGYSCQGILLHYYTGVKITQCY
jgi:stage II sporulation protein D